VKSQDRLVTFPEALKVVDPFGKSPGAGSLEKADWRQEMKTRQREGGSDEEENGEKR
jgi:hypothetical protein